MLFTFCVFSLAGLLIALQQSDEHDRILAEVSAHHLVAKQPHLVRRESPTEEAFLLQTGNAPSPHISSGKSYDELVKETTGLVAYWPLDDPTGVQAEAHGPACGQADGDTYGDPCQVDGEIKGAPLLNQTSLLPGAHSEDKAIEFGIQSAQKIVIPNHAMINTNTSGYPAKTVELWFKAGDLGTNNRSIFEDGNKQHSGLNIYAREAGSGEIDLFMYAWNRGVSGGSDDRPMAEYGTPNINPQPLRCTVKKNVNYYAAFVFDQHARTIKGYTKSADDAEDVKLCGKIKNMPAGAVIAHAGGDDGGACIGGIQGTSRLSGGCSVYNDNPCVMMGGGHNFIGTIDNVAIYNEALSEGELQTHVAAAGPFHSGNIATTATTNTTG